MTPRNADKHQFPNETFTLDPWKSRGFMAPAPKRPARHRLTHSFTLMGFLVSLACALAAVWMVAKVYA